MNTATPMQSFIEQMRLKSKPKNKTGNQHGYFTEPLYSRYMGNTGMGEDGKLQPDNPTAIVQGGQGPVAIHEGEDLYQKPNGNTTVVPAMMSQNRMKAMARNMDIPGMQWGGEIMKKAVNNVTGTESKPDPSTLWGGENVQNVVNNVTGNTPTTVARTIAAPLTQGATTITAPQTEAQPQVSTVARTVTVPNEPVATKISAPPTAITPPTGGTTVARTVTTPTAAPAATEIKAPAATPAATTTTPTTPTSTDYMEKAMARLEEIMQGGSPAQQAIAQKQLNELRASQGLQQRVAGFEAAQAGLRFEAASAQMAMGRAVAGSQLAGAASDIAAAEMKQRETSAQTLAQLAPSMQNMEINKQNQVANLVNQGYTKDQINAQMGTNLSDNEYASLRNASSLGQTEINRKIAAGDYAGANKLLSDAGLPSVDFSKPEAQYQLEKLQQVPSLVEQGLSLSEINSKLGLNLTQGDYDKVLYSSTRGQNQISAKVAAGDYAGANALLNAAGLASIDFSKVEAGESRAAITDIDNLLSSLGDDADPAVVTALTSAKTAILGKVWDSLGIDTSTMTITNSDGTKTSIANLLTNIDNPTEQKTVQTVAKITDGVDSWLDAGNGDVILEQLSTSDSWNALYEKAQGGDSAAATEMGKLLGAAMTNELYVNGSSTIAPNATQKALLEKYGVWHEAKPSTVTTDANITSIKDKLESGDTAGAQKLYDSLTPAEKESVGTFEELSASGLKTRADTIVNTQNFAALAKLPTTDPLYQEVLGKMPSASFGYSDKALVDDQFTNAPAVGTWIKYKTPNGDKILKVTYSGHVDTSGSSNRAYMEFEDTEGNVYSTDRDSTTLRRGAEPTYKKV